MRGFDQGQKLRRKGELVAAKEQLVICAHQGCPAVASVRCKAWLDEVRAGIPSVVIVANNHDGSGIAAAQLHIDDNLERDDLERDDLERDDLERDNLERDNLERDNTRTRRPTACPRRVSA